MHRKRFVSFVIHFQSSYHTDFHIVSFNKIHYRTAQNLFNFFDVKETKNNDLVENRNGKCCDHT